MFSFTLHHNFTSSGISPDLILPSAKNRFDCFFAGLHALDGRLQVRINEQVIRFFYYPHEVINPVIEHEYKEIVSISLTDSKESDFDILYLGNHCRDKAKMLWPFLELNNNDKDKSHYPQNWKDQIESIKKVIRRLAGEKDKSRLFGFPFIEMEEEPKDDIDLFVRFVQLCFLYFIIEIESRSSDFSKSPFYDEVRSKLRQSFVYRLLCAKVKYTFYLFEKEPPQSQKEYTFKARSYAELLMDEQINASISPSYYKENQTYIWFYNPEEELEQIVETNHSFGNQPAAQLEQSLLDSIRDFFYKKHAVFSAMMASVSKKSYYKIYWIAIFIFTSITTVFFILYDKDWSLVNLFFNNFVFIGWCVVLGIIPILLLIIILCKTKGNFAHFMPRVLVALSIGWLTAFISEDLIKSQLEISWLLTLLALLFVLFIVTSLLLGEVKQHSPYYTFSDVIKHPFKRTFFSSWKLWPVVLHSYFFAMVFGIVMQLVVYPGLLENSEALPEIVYENTFDDAETYVMYLDEFKESLTTYRQDMDGMFVKAVLSGVVNSPSLLLYSKEKDKQRSFQETAIMEGRMVYDERELAKIKTRGKTKTEHIRQSFEAVRDFAESHGKGLDALVSQQHKSTSFLVGDYKSISFGDSIIGLDYGKVENELDSLEKRIDDFASSSDSIDDNVNLMLASMDLLIDASDVEIQMMKRFISENNKYPQLIKWSCARMRPYEKVKSMREIIQNEALQKHYFSRSIYTLKDGSPVPLFPRMLVLHALMVLIIAFVGQLIISDKSVTEPL